MKYWDKETKGFYLEQNENNSREELSDEKWLELLNEHSNGKVITNDNMGRVITMDYVVDQKEVNKIRIQELQQLLKETSAQVIEHNEGLISDEDYEKIKNNRIAWREELKKLEADK